MRPVMSQEVGLESSIRRAVVDMILEDYGDIAAMIDVAMEVAVLPGICQETLVVKEIGGSVPSLEFRLFKRYSIRGWGIKVVLAKVEIEYDWPNEKVVTSVVKAMLHAAAAIDVVDGPLVRAARG